MKNDVKIFFPLSGMIIITILMIAGFGLSYYANDIKEMYMINDPYYEMNYVTHIIINFFGLGFIFVGIYCWFRYIINVIVKPKIDILYLESIEGSRCVFVNKKGKTFFMLNYDFIPEKFYKVLKTSDFIHEVIGVTEEESIKPKVKESYWLGLYSPFGSFENLLLLPGIYLALVAAILIFVNTSGILKIISGGFLLYVLLIIGYDYICKRNKKENNGELDDNYIVKIKEEERVAKDEKKMKFQYKFEFVKKIIVTILFNIILVIMIIFSADNITRLAVLPFLIFGIGYLVTHIFYYYDKEKIANIIYKASEIIFIISFFAFIFFIAE